MDLHLILLSTKSSEPSGRGTNPFSSFTFCFSYFDFILVPAYRSWPGRSGLVVQVSPFAFDLCRRNFDTKEWLKPVTLEIGWQRI